jgi:predicted DNA-binding transcriptional regulator YafY
MADALLRHWYLLRALPRAPAKRDVTSLHRTLEQSGYRITRRQLQRDLHSLSRIFPIQADERGGAFGWSWARNAALIDLPGMDPRTALTLRLVEQFIPQLLPPVVSEELRPYFTRARHVLKSGRASGLGRWADCVRVVPREMPLLPPKFDRDATRVVYDALLAGKRFTARYASRSRETAHYASGPDERDGPRDYEISPLGIVVRGSLIYLVCTLWDYEDIRQLAVHRLTRARLLEKPAARPPNFDVDTYVEQGAFQYPVGPSIRLRAVFSRDAAMHLHETPLSADQSINDVDKDHVQVTATVANTKQLEWWLLGFGEKLEVVAPKVLRDAIANRASATVDRYSMPRTTQ